jgi:hypothetical protein
MGHESRRHSFSKYFGLGNSWPELISISKRVGTHFTSMFVVGELCVLSLSDKGMARNLSKRSSTCRMDIGCSSDVLMDGHKNL